MMEKVYLAGRISDVDWRLGLIHGTYGYQRTGVEYWEPNQFRNEPDRLLKLSKTACGYRDVYMTGPHFASCDHRCAHTHPDSKHALSQMCGDGIHPHEVFTRCLYWIDQADWVFVWADGDYLEAHGTHLEIGYAFARGKPIFIAVNKYVDLGEAWMTFRTARAVVHARNAVEGFQQIMTMRNKTIPQMPPGSVPRPA
ncbi:nucleoside 2-deoxyribosyltransferase [Shimia aestuarii]|uniref:Nucleoside 2-deoxyribosyltransferase n=1 Tax=Shimia aestuarii TaxID=254406 RepID=A0A1I4N6S7_9RHOB|nr:nucleoside 2-deoxyribosyltransferase [Shimia aestuarii]SFM11211.1 Nucleoside 2-deoxyribosyltransferase [Shimia aestuarii]